MVWKDGVSGEELKSSFFSPKDFMTFFEKFPLLYSWIVLAETFTLMSPNMNLCGVKVWKKKGVLLVLKNKNEKKLKNIPIGFFGFPIGLDFVSEKLKSPLRFLPQTSSELKENMD